MAKPDLTLPRTYSFFPDLSDLHAENGGVAILRPGWVHPERNLDTSVLILGWKSRVHLEEDGEPVLIEPGRVTILTAGRTHRGTRELDEPASYYWIHFKSNREPQVMNRDEVRPILGNTSIAGTRLSDSILLPREFRVGDTREFDRWFHEILFEEEHPCFTPVKKQLMFRMLMISLNEYILRKNSTTSNPVYREGLMNLIIQTITENLTDGNFSVKYLADAIGYNPDYLCRVFRSFTGMSIRDYIIDQRVQYATTRLSVSSDTVQKIAFDSGFMSVRNFIRQFKLRKGTTPSALRQRYRTMHITSS